jgi:hypothetical protein
LYSNPNIVEFNWSYSDEVISTDSFLTFLIDGEQVIEIIALEVWKPLCLTTNSQNFSVSELPIAEITENGAILSANLGDSYQWLLNGEIIEDANWQTLEVT